MKEILLLALVSSLLLAVPTFAAVGDCIDPRTGFATPETSQYCENEVFYQCSNSEWLSTVCTVDTQCVSSGGCVKYCELATDEKITHSGRLCHDGNLMTCENGAWAPYRDCPIGCAEGATSCTPGEAPVGLDLAEPDMISVIRTASPRVVLLRYAGSYGVGHCGISFSGSYENPDWNIVDWSINEKYNDNNCVIDESTPTSAKFTCTITDSWCGETPGFVQGGWSKSMLVEVRAESGWSGCIELPTYYEEGRSRCQDNAVYACGERHVFELKEDCSLTPNTLCQETSGYPKDAYCQTKCNWEHPQLGSVVATEGQVKCLFNGDVEVSNGDALADSGLYVCGSAGEFEKIYDVDCWVPYAKYPHTLVSRFTGDEISGYCTSWTDVRKICRGGSPFAYGKWYAPCGDAPTYPCVTAASIGYEYISPEDVAPEPPNPSSIIHFSWFEDAWNNFVSWLTGVINSIF